MFPCVSYVHISMGHHKFYNQSLEYGSHIALLHSKSSQSSKPWRTSVADVVPLISPKFLKLFPVQLLLEEICMAAGESLDEADVAVVLESYRDTITEPNVCLFRFKSWGVVVTSCDEFVAVSLVR